MEQMTIILAAAIVFFIAERVRPGRALPSSAGWFARAALLNGAQLAVVALAGLTWNRWLQHASLLHIDVLPPIAQGLLGWFIGTFVFYWWHRARHKSDFLWSTLHRVHHTPTRIETLTSFYKHPLEIAANSVIASALMFALLGASVAGAAWFNVFAAIGEMCYHANLRTPRWWGWFLQRPEHHSIHHEQGVHDHNFGDVTWWDRLFGTFVEAEEFAKACGLDNEPRSAGVLAGWSAGVLAGREKR